MKRILMFKIVLGLIVALIIGILPVYADTATLLSIQDTYISGKSQDQHDQNGALDSLEMRDKDSDLNYILLSFETMSGLPLYEELVSGSVAATLSLYKTNGAGSFTSAAYRVTNGPWDETADWIHMKHDTSSWIIPGGDFTTDGATPTIETTPNNQWSTWDITEIVKYWWQHPLENYGLIIRGTSGDSGWRKYGSSESANVPKIDIEYEPENGGGPQVPEPASAALFTIGILGMLGRKLKRKITMGGSMKKLLVVLALVALCAGNAWAVPSINGLIDAGEWDGSLFYLTDGDEAGTGIGNIPNAYDMSAVYVYQGATDVYFRLDTFSAPLDTNGSADVYIKAYLDFDNDLVYEDSIYVNYLGAMEVMKKNGGYTMTTGTAAMDDIWEFSIPNSYLSGTLNSNSKWYVLLDNGGDNADDRVPNSTTVPEPMSISLLGLGLLGAVSAGLKRKK